MARCGSATPSVARQGVYATVRRYRRAPRCTVTYMSSFEPVPSQDDVSEALAERLSVLDTLAERRLQEHPDVYQQLHADLQATLAEIDSA